MATDFSNVKKIIFDDQELADKKALTTKPLFENKSGNSLFDSLKQYNEDFPYETGDIAGDFYGDPNHIKWANQSWQTQLGNSAMQMLGREIIGGTFQGIGAIADIPDMIMSLAQDEDLDFSNFITEFGNDIMEATQEAYPIYRKNPGKAWDMIEDFGWWAEGAVSVASTLGLLIPAYGTTRAVLGAARWMSKLGKLGKAAGLSQRAEYFIKSTTMPISMRHGENYRESLDTKVRTWDSVYEKFAGMSKDQLAEWINSEEGKNFKVDVLKLDEDQKFVPGTDVPNKDFIPKPNQDKETPQIDHELVDDLTARKMADYISSEAGWRSYVNNAPNVIFDAIQLQAAIGLFRSTTRPGLLEKAFGFRPTKVLKADLVSKTESVVTKAVKSKLAGNRLRNYGLFIGGQGTEGIEEIVNAVAQNEGLEYGKYLIGKKNLLDKADYTQRLSIYLDDPHTWEQAFWGFMGGMAFGGAMVGYRKALSASGYNRTESSLLKDIQGRYLKLQRLAQYSSDIKDGYDIFKTNYNSEEKVKFEGTPEQIESQKAKQLNELSNKMWTDLATSAAKNGASESLDNYVDHKNTKAELKKIADINNQDFDQFISDGKQTLRDVEQVYKDLKVKFRASAIDERIANILISNVITNKGEIKRIERELATNQDVITSLMQDDAFKAAPEIKIGDQTISIDQAIDTFTKIRLLEDLNKLVEDETERGSVMFENKSTLKNFYQTRVDTITQELGLTKEEIDTYKGRELDIQKSIVNALGGGTIGFSAFKEYSTAKYNILTLDVDQARREKAVVDIQSSENAKETEDRVRKDSEDHINDIINAHKETFRTKLREIALDSDIEKEAAEKLNIYMEVIEKDNSAIDKKLKKKLRNQLEEAAKEEIDTLKQKAGKAKQEQKLESGLRSKILNALSTKALDVINKQTTLVEKDMALDMLTRPSTKAAIESLEEGERKEELRAKYEELANPPLENSKYNDDKAAIIAFGKENPNATNNTKLEKLIEVFGKNFHTYSVEERNQALVFEQALTDRIFEEDPSNAFAILIQDTFKKYKANQTQSVTESESTENTTPIEDYEGYKRESAKKIFHKYLEDNDLTAKTPLLFDDVVQSIYSDILEAREKVEIFPSDQEFIGYVDGFLKDTFEYAKKKGIISKESKFSGKLTANIIESYKESLRSEELSQQDESYEGSSKLSGVSMSLDQTRGLNYKRAEGDVAIDESDARKYQALLSLTEGSEVTLRINTDHTKYDKDAETNDNTPIAMMANGEVVAHLPHIKGINDNLDMITKIVRDENIAMINLLYDQILELKKGYTDSTIHNLAQGTTELGEYLLYIFGMYSTNLSEKLISTEATAAHNAEFKAKLGTFLNVVVRQNAVYKNIEILSESELQASLDSWSRKLLLDLRGSLTIRRELGMDINKIVTATIGKITSGNALFATDKNGTVERTLDQVFDNISDIHIYDASKGSTPQGGKPRKLVDQETGESVNDFTKEEGFAGAGMGYVIIEGIGLDEAGNRRHIPVPLMTSTHSKVLNDQQKKYNEAAPAKILGFIKDYLDEQAINGGKVTVKLEELQKKLMGYIYLRKLNKIDNINFVYGDTDVIEDGAGKTRTVKVKRRVIIMRSKFKGPIRYTIKIYNEDGSTYKSLSSAKDDFLTTFNDIISKTRRNLNYNLFREFRDKKYTDEITGEPYSSYKEFAVKTGLITTTLGAVRSKSGTILGHVTMNNANNGRRIGRSLNIRIDQGPAIAKPKTILGLHKELAKDNRAADDYIEVV